MIRLSGFSHSVLQAGESISYACDVAGPSVFPPRLEYLAEGAAPGLTPTLSANWVAVGMLYPAMLLGEDLHIEGSVHSRLLYFLRNDIQFLLKANDPDLKLVKIIATEDDAPRQAPAAPARVATGFSAGIDSFATLASFTGDAAPHALRITDLTLFYVGAHGKEQGGARDMFLRQREKSKAFAKENGFAFTSVKSNLNDFYRSVKLGFQRTHTMRNASAALILENSIRHYFYSSTLSYPEIKVTRIRDIANVDAALLPMLSTEKLVFFSSCAGLSRFEKTKLVANLAPACDVLDVCVANLETRSRLSGKNCSRCYKCARTMVMLDALGALDRFSPVFDIEYYRANGRAVMSTLAKKAFKGSPADKEAITVARQSGLPVPLYGHLMLQMQLRKMFA